MSWLLWRQHRAGSFVLAAVLVAFGVAVVLTGLHMTHVYDDAVAACPTGRDCTSSLARLFDGYGAIIDVVHLTIVLPVVLGAFLGATLIARETEHSTNVLVWTQGATRRRWTVTSVLFALAATAAAAAITSILVTWWSGTTNALHGDRFQGAQFDTQNVVPVAHALFAVGLGIAAGAVLRRSLPAIALTVGVYIGVRMLVTLFLRPRFGPTSSVTALFSQGFDGAEVPPGSWTVSSHVVDARGHNVDGALRVPDSCGQLGRGSIERCMDALGYRQVTRFHAASQYWRFQWTESLLYVGLAAVLAIVGILVTMRRDA